MSEFWNGEMLAAPNLITICVDESRSSEISGRLYHCYSQEPQPFENVVQLIRYMEEFYDSIKFPESSVALREFRTDRAKADWKLSDPMDRSYLTKQKGKSATFYVHVKYRQNATWQGKLTWKEGKKEMEFRSVLELIIEIDAILGRE